MDKVKSAPDIVREIIGQTLAHGIEIASHVELMEAQNTGGVNETLSAAGLNNVAIAIKNAIMTRIVLMIAREFSKPRDDDRNLHRAIDILKADQFAKDVFNQRPADLASAITSFDKLKGDNRLQEIVHFRDKYTAHIGEPKGVPLPKYKDLFSFARDMIKCIDLVAAATRLAEVSIEGNNDAKTQAADFWKPWRKAE